MNQDEIKNLMRRHGFNRMPKQLTIGSAIALCEAAIYEADPPEADPHLIGDQTLADSTWGYSYGLWQIRSLRADKGTGRIRDETRLLDPAFNATSMRAIYQAGGWWPWSTFRSGAFRAYAQDIKEYQPPPGSYFVVAGDTLSGIAAKLSNGAWTWQDLARVNGLHEDPLRPGVYLIRIGDILLLPTP